MAWEKSREFATPPLVYYEMMSEEQAQKFHTDDASLDLSVVLMIGGAAREICFNQ